MEAIFVISEVVLAGLVFIFNLLGMRSAISISFAASFIVILVYLVFSGIAKRANSILLILIVLSGLNVLINGTMNHNVSINFDYLKKLFFFYTSIIFFQLVVQIEITKKTAGIIERIVLAMTVFLVIDYYILGNHTMLGRYLTLGFTNPNFTAMWLMHLGLFLIYYFVAIKSRFLKVFCVAAFIFVISIILKTENRSTLVVFAFFFVMFAIGAIRKKYSLHKVTLIVAVLFPFIFFMLYRLLLSNTAITKFFEFAVSIGKGLDSRKRIWDYATGLLLDNGWIIGDYASLHVNNSTGMLQMHNSHLDVLVSYGIIPFVLFLFVHYKIIKTANEKIISFKQYVAFCCFLSVMMHGTFEAGIYAGCTGLNFLSGVFLLVAMMNSTDEGCNSTDEGCVHQKEALPERTYE